MYGIKVFKLFFKDFIWQFIFLFFLGLLTSFISFIHPIIGANIVTGITEESIKRIFVLAIVYFLLQFSLRLVNFVSNTLFSKVKLQCVLNIRMKLCQKILNIKMHEFDERSSGVFLERIKNDTNDIITIFNDIQDYFLEIITNIGMLFYVFWINIWIGIFYTIGVCALFIIQKTRIQVLLKRTRELKTIQEENTSILNEYIRGIKDIKSLGLDKTFLNHLYKTFKKNSKKSHDMNYQTYFYNCFYFTIRSLLMVIILSAGVLLMIQGKITAANLIVVYMYRNNIFSFVIHASKLGEAIGKFKISADRVLEVLEDEYFEIDQYGTKKLKEMKGSIEFQNVTFSYDKKKNVLKNVNFSIQPKTVTAIVGKSGSGKSTIFNILAKLYVPKKGNVFLDGYSLEDISKESLRKNMIFITQNPYVFKMSIKENLRLANPKAKEREIYRACREACIHDFIMSLPDKYDTILGEAGVNISGGQRQRLAIARALLKKANVLLLDEATSALDNETQEDIKKTIENISKHCTVILIAHRLSTIKNADQILVLDKGKIVDTGTHKQLIKKSEIYKNLYNGSEK